MQLHFYTRDEKKHSIKNKTGKMQPFCDKSLYKYTQKLNLRLHHAWTIDSIIIVKSMLGLWFCLK